MRQGHKSIPIEDKSSVGDARRTAMQIAQALGFDEDRRSDIGIVVTEAATNILVHASKGELLLCPFGDGGDFWIDIFALDSGPGIGDVGRAMQDGFSSVGTAGDGLGAIGRLSDESSLYTVPGQGTAYWSRFMSGGRSSVKRRGLINLPLHGETVCGDSYFIQDGALRTLYMMVDGLGHGAGAAEAASEAVAAVSRYSQGSAAELVVHAHDALKKTRGAAMSVAIIDHESRILTYAGVGNVTATLIMGTSSKNLVSQNGTLGAILPRVPQQFSFPIEQSATLLMFTDGLTTKTNPSVYVGLQSRHPALIAGVLLRDFSRRRDDATILVTPIGGGLQ